VQTQVKRGLNDPDSAQFSNVTFSRSTKAGCGLVNARNRMGGDVGATAFVLTPAGDVSFEPREGVSLSPEDKLASLKEQLAFFELAAKHCPNWQSAPPLHFSSPLPIVLYPPHNKRIHMLTAIGASSTSASGSGTAAEVAKITRQITATQKQITATQKTLVETPEGDARKAVEQQLQSLTTQLAMLQAQLKAVQAAALQKSAEAKEVKAVEQGASPSNAFRTNANGVPIGGTLNVEA
jgi:hypothetical protein